MIVLDASGSMNQTDAPGPRIDAAKTAVTTLLGTMPTDTQVGLMVYGAGTGSTDAEKTAGCQDIKTLAPVGPLDTAALTAQVTAITASGYTPIGNALKAAATELERALPNEGPRSIVLVSDGEDTCAPPAPCDVATDLHQQGIDLTVHTVGFKVDPAARDQLSCIAAATGGTYSDATDAGQLTTQALQTKVDYAITGYTTAGTPVAGADQPSDQAPLLAPGQYVDTLAQGASDDIIGVGTTRYYTIPVLYRRAFARTSRRP
jgi:Ca-activated chloride channel family protein